MRVVLDGRFIQDHFPGIGRYTYNLAVSLGRLAAPTDDLIVLVDRPAVNSRFDLGLLARTPGLTVRDVNAPIFNPIGSARLTWVLQRLDLDVFHSPHYLFPPVVRGRAVVNLFDLIPEIPLKPPSPRQWLSRVAYHLGVSAAIRRAAKIIVPSESTAVDLARFHGVRDRRVARVPIGVDPRFAPVSQQSIDNVRHRFNLPTRFVLTVGINKPHKNHAGLVSAFCLPAIPRDVDLVIAGPIDRRFPTAIDFARGLGSESRVRVLGEAPGDDLPALYAAADVFAFPSFDEGFGLPPLEAMRCGTPVACARAGAIPEIVGDAAMYFDPADSSDIAATIGALLNDTIARERLRAAGLTRAARFNWDEVAVATWQVYRDAVKA